MSSRLKPDIPHDLDAEKALLGDLISGHHQSSAEAAEQLVVEDFYSPLHGEVFSAVMDMRSHGERIDVAAVRDEIRRRGQEVDTSLLLDLVTNWGGGGRRYADTIANHSLARRIIKIAQGIDGMARQPGNAGEVLDAAKAELASVDRVVGNLPSDLSTLDDFLDKPATVQNRWLVRGLLRVGWRVMIIAAEGRGKSYLFRQFAATAAQGIHPLRFESMPPIRTLLVDLENPEDIVIDACKPIRDQALRTVGVADYEPGRAWLWHHPQGINLRSRTGRVAFEKVLAATRPDMVCMGPVYKMYRVSAKDNDEMAAAEVMAVLDDLRTRYRFGLLLEHHAPKKQSGDKTREMLPYGSSLWLRWPEVGIKLTTRREGDTRVEVGRWRGDRLPTDWPNALTRGQIWPWEGYWEGES